MNDIYNMNKYDKSDYCTPYSPPTDRPLLLRGPVDRDHGHAMAVARTRQEHDDDNDDDGWYGMMSMSRESQQILLHRTPC